MPSRPEAVILVKLTNNPGPSDSTRGFAADLPNVRLHGASAAFDDVGRRGMQVLDFVVESDPIQVRIVRDRKSVITASGRAGRWGRGGNEPSSSSFARRATPKDDDDLRLDCDHSAGCAGDSCGYVSTSGQPQQRCSSRQRDRHAAIRLARQNGNSRFDALCYREAQAAGAKTLRAIATALNERGVATPRGRWEAKQIANVLRRIDIDAVTA